MDPPDTAGLAHQPGPTATTTNHPHPIAGNCHGTAHGVAEQLRARRVAAYRLPALPCGCREVWPHRQGCTHRDPAITERLLDGAHAAAKHLLELGLCPIFPADTLRALWRRGGTDRQLAQQLWELAR